MVVRGNGASLNEQNPDRGIETCGLPNLPRRQFCLNEQNPDRGIETAILLLFLWQQLELE